MLAGCSGRTGDATDSPTRSARETARPVASDATGSARSTVTGLEVRATDPFVADPLFGVDVTVTNAGDRETDVFRYEYEFALATDGGTGARPDGTELQSGEDVRLAPGETARFVARTEVDGDPSAVTGFDLTLTCTGTSRGVYCES
jgi:hypothetical protein